LVWYDFGTHGAVDTVDVADATDGYGHRWIAYVWVAG
jgi:hypothetical protein